MCSSGMIFFDLCSTVMQHLPINLPCADLLGNSENYHDICVPLYWALTRGDCEAAKIIFSRHPQLELVRYSITNNHETPLHIAVYNKQGENFVKQIVGMMDMENLKLQNGQGETALFTAVVAGNVKMAKILVEKNKELLKIPDNRGRLPLSVAASRGNRDMVTYLYASSEKMKDNPWTLENRDCVLVNCICADLFEIALQIVNDCPELAASGNALRTLARKTEAFKREANPTLMETIGLATRPNSALRLLRIMCDSILELPKNDIDETSTTLDVQNPNYISEMLFIAVEEGNTAFVVELISRYPDLIPRVNDKKQSLFHVAISHRHKDICTLLYQIDSIKDSVITLEDEDGNNLLHLVGEKPKRFHDVLRVDQQMQQELKWFEEVEAILPYSFQEMKNNYGLTPRELFTETHKDLVSVGEKLLKIEAVRSTVFAAFIAALAFAVVLNGLTQGTPTYLHGRYFTAFMVLVSISLISSLASILVLRSIITSRFAERDFLQTLPRKHLISRAALINAIMTFITAFYLCVFVLGRNSPKGRVFVIISILFIIPNSLCQQYRLFVGMFRSRGSFFSH